MEKLWVVQKLVEETDSRAWSDTKLFTSQEKAMAQLEEWKNEIKDSVCFDEDVTEDENIFSYDLEIYGGSSYSVIMFEQKVEDDNKEEPKKATEEKPHIITEYVDGLVGNANQIMSKDQRMHFANYLENIGIEVRMCSHCEGLMSQGYVIEGGYEYYCNDSCLEKHYSQEEWNRMCEESEENYWTEWN